MGKKIFVSYKYSDSNVKSLPGSIFTTARNYVDEIDELLKDGDHLYKGEDDDEDLSHLSEATIEKKLRDRIYDSSLTIVLISKGMKESYKPERNQWIPREVSYSLRETSRAGRTSMTNAILAVVLPSNLGNYSYFMEYSEVCDSTTYHTNILFPILRNNMFNKKNSKTRECQGKTIHEGYFSYMYCVKWDTFKSSINKYLNVAYDIYDNKDEYDIVKTLESGY